MVTFGLWLLRGDLDDAHMALVYLLVVLGASARHGRGLGFAVAVFCFLAFNLFLLPPYYTLAIADPLDWLVLLTFLATAAVAAQLLDRARRETVVAKERAREIDRLSAIGAEALNAGTAADGVQAIAKVMRSTLGVGLCEVYSKDPSGPALHLIGRDEVAGERGPPASPEDLIRYVVENDAVAIERVDGTTHLAPGPLRPLEDVLRENGDARTLLVPLAVRNRPVGALRLAGTESLRVSPGSARFATVLSYYAALAVERVRLAAEAERVEGLREADRLKDALVASVSHDLRTPLTTIKALARELRSSGDERACLIEEEADRLNRMVEDLLDLSRLRGKALRLDLQVHAAEDLLGAALARVGAIPGAGDIRPRLVGDHGVMLGRFDFVHSLRALANLLDNGLRHAGGAPLDVVVRREGDRLVFEVMDRGSGLTPEEVTRLFEPFQGSAVPHRARAGLGLAISREIAQAHGGSVEYRPREGGGSVFTLGLPAADPIDVTG
jgi:two-component system sensor histidine kinase KdpD